MVGSAVKYMALGIVAVSLLLLVFGYFGCILSVLIVVITVGVIASIYEIRQFWLVKEERDEREKSRPIDDS
jgi:hypothetical protein